MAETPATERGSSSGGYGGVMPFVEDLGEGETGRGGTEGIPWEILAARPCREGSRSSGEMGGEGGERLGRGEVWEMFGKT